MHELSIAMSILDLAQEEAKSRGVRVTAVHLKLGVLAGVVKQALSGSYDIAAAGTPLEGSRLVIEDVPVVVFCSACRERRQLHSMCFQCPECGAPTPEVLEGQELQVTALEVET